MVDPPLPFRPHPPGPTAHIARRRRLAEQDATVVARIGTRADAAVFNAASSTHLEANDVVAGLFATRSRVRIAAVVAGPEFTGRRNTMADLHNCSAQIQKSQKTLAAALDRTVVRVSGAEEPGAVFHVRRVHRRRARQHRPQLPAGRATDALDQLVHGPTRLPRVAV